MSVSTCGGLIHGGLIFGGAYSRRFTVYSLQAGVYCYSKCTHQHYIECAHQLTAVL